MDVDYVKVTVRTQAHPNGPFGVVFTLGVKDPPVPLPESFDITHYSKTNPTVQLRSFYCLCLGQTDEEKKAYIKFIQYLHSAPNRTSERRYAKVESADGLFFLYAPPELPHRDHVTGRTLLYCAYVPPIAVAPPHTLAPSAASSSFNIHPHLSSMNRVHHNPPVLPPTPLPINNTKQPVPKGILKPKTPVSTVKATVGGAQNRTASMSAAANRAPVSVPSSSAVRFGTSLSDKPVTTSSSYTGLTYDSLVSTDTSTTPSTATSFATSRPVTSSAVSSSTATSTASSNMSTVDPLANYVARGIKISALEAAAQHHSSWVFGAFAELIDNAYDAKASNIYLDIVHQSGMPLAVVSDDGHGMTHSQIENMLMFGHDARKMVKDGVRIGKYGVGFKSGTMRIGKDALVLTKCEDTVSMALLSLTLNEERENGILIPLVTWKRSTMEFDSLAHSKEVAEAMEKLIFEYSPITNKYLLGQHFAEIKETGTRVYMFNLENSESRFELDWKTDPTDIRISNDMKNRLFLRQRRGQLTNDVPLDYSLKAYCEVLFLKPKANIHVRGHQVVNRPILPQLTRHESKTLEAYQVTIGYSEDMKRRGLSGVMMYWHNRLILAYLRCGLQSNKADAALGCIGVFSCVHELNPKNNKQEFTEGEKYTQVLDFLDDSMDSYWYESVNRADVVIDSEAAETLEVEHDWVQCSGCHKWRRLPVGAAIPARHLAWYCYMNPENTHNGCSAPEENHSDDVTLRLSIGGIDKRELAKKKQAEEKNKQLRKPVSSSSDSSSSSRSPSPAPRKERKEPTKALQNSAVKKVKMEKAIDDYEKRNAEKQNNNTKGKLQKADTTKPTTNNNNNNTSSKTTANSTSSSSSSSSSSNSTSTSNNNNNKQTFQSVSVASNSHNYAPMSVLKKRKPVETVNLDSDEDEPERESKEQRTQKFKQTPNNKGLKRKQDALNGRSTSKNNHQEEDDEDEDSDVLDLNSPAPVKKKTRKLRRIDSDGDD